MRTEGSDLKRLGYQKSLHHRECFGTIRGFQTHLGRVLDKKFNTFYGILLRCPSCPSYWVIWVGPWSCPMVSYMVSREKPYLPQDAQTSGPSNPNVSPPFDVKVFLIKLKSEGFCSNETVFHSSYFPRHPKVFGPLMKVLATIVPQFRAFRALLLVGGCPVDSHDFPWRHRINVCFFLTKHWPLKNKYSQKSILQGGSRG